MLYKRKIYDKLLRWKNESLGKKALLVEGARRVGKSTVVEEFAKKEYDSYLLIDFSKISGRVKNIFKDHLDDIDLFYQLLGAEVKSSKNYSVLSLNAFQERFQKRIGTPYVIHPKNLKTERGVVFLPAYMTWLL